MSEFANVAESRIQEALEAGQFENLQGHGQPLDLSAYFAAPSSLRAGFSLLKSASIVPPEVLAMQDIARLREILATIAEQKGDAHDRETAALRAELRLRETELAMALERMKLSLKADATS